MGRLNGVPVLVLPVLVLHDSAETHFSPLRQIDIIM